MGSQSQVVDRKEIERRLCQIPEIEATRVVYGKEHEILELHVLASGQRAPRQIVRDIESLLMARYSLPIDHKKISIAQINSDSEPVVHKLGRLKINDIAFRIRGDETTFEISLEQNGRQETSTVRGSSSKNERLRLAALATLDAASKLKQSQLTFALEHLSIVPTGQGSVALVLVSAISRAGEEVFSGSAVVKGNEDDAVIKASLSAINRKLAIN